VRARDSALSMFHTLERHNLSAVPIVDEEGRMVGQTSSADLKVRACGVCVCACVCVCLSVSVL